MTAKTLGQKPSWKRSRVSAAICRAHNWSAMSVIGHKEWTNIKIDPKGFTMPSLRARVATRLKAKPSSTDTGVHTDSLPVGPLVSLAHVREAARKDPSAAQGHAIHRTEVQAVEYALYVEGLLAEKWCDGSYGTKTLAAYATWQKRCGFTGKDADGIPGRPRETPCLHRPRLKPHTPTHPTRNRSLTMASTSITSGAFWTATAERAVRTFAQTLLATLGLDATDLLALP